MEAEELREDTAHSGCPRISELRDRQVTDVAGRVRSVALRPRSTVSALQVDLYDGTGVLQLVWLGRRSIRGIEPGTHLTAHGRVTSLHGNPTIFNPSYELVPDRDS